MPIVFFYKKSGLFCGTLIISSKITNNFNVFFIFLEKNIVKITFVFQALFSSLCIEFLGSIDKFVFKRFGIYF